jgi:hypothetical protein
MSHCGHSSMTGGAGSEGRAKSLEINRLVRVG